jgi:hypothetical protein
MDEVPGDNPAPGITRANLTHGDYGSSATSVPAKQANEGMSTAYPTEAGKRSLNGPTITNR